MQDKPHLVLALAAFDYLRAEEEPWLAEAFVAPGDFALLLGPRSTVLYGESGSGKTTLLRMIAQAAPTDAFCLFWTPALESDQALDNPDVWAEGFLQTCAVALRGHFARHPQGWSTLPGWAQGFLTDFLRRYREPLWEMECARLRAGLDASGQAWLDQMMAPLSAPAPYDTTALSRARLLEYLAEAIAAAGWQSLWVFGDGFQIWEQHEDAAVEKAVQAGLGKWVSSLTLLDQQAFTLKLALPLGWREALQGMRAIRTRRLDEYILTWEKDDLVAIVNKRLRLAAGRPDVHLATLCPTCALNDWLWRYAGANPRRWLGQARSLYQAYRQAGDRPLTPEAWRQLNRRLAPYLTLAADEKGVVYVGPHRVELTEPLYKVLAYLYGEDRVCSREELYFVAYKGLERVPRRGETGWEEPTAWRGILDTVLWRLRKAIEPDPDRPMFVQTVRGQGVKLARVSTARERSVR
jgi:DNA-binding winged helix-turn-helix (wHTH) protein/energy-coupling factor transporter ATP-binding protein EcfA2